MSTARNSIELTELKSQGRSPEEIKSPTTPVADIGPDFSCHAKKRVRSCYPRPIIGYPTDPEYREMPLPTKTWADVKDGTYEEQMEYIRSLDPGTYRINYRTKRAESEMYGYSYNWFDKVEDEICYQHRALQYKIWDSRDYLFGLVWDALFGSPSEPVGEESINGHVESCHQEKKMQ